MTKKDLMIQAWRFYKMAKGITFSQALTKAWELKKAFKNDIKINEIEGTEKQLKWANDIINRLTKELENGMKETGKLLRDNGIKIDSNLYTAVALVLKDFLKTVSKASELINFSLNRLDNSEFWIEQVRNYKFF